MFMGAKVEGAAAGSFLGPDGPLHEPRLYSHRRSRGSRYGPPQLATARHERPVRIVSPAPRESLSSFARCAGLGMTDLFAVEVYHPSPGCLVPPHTNNRSPFGSPGLGVKKIQKLFSSQPSRSPATGRWRSV